jgi:DNA-binding MarR family transcriptional regulator
MSSLFDRLQEEIEFRDAQPGLTPTDLLELPPAIAEILQRIIRRNGMPLADIAAELKQPAGKVAELLDKLVAKGYIRRTEIENVIWYKAHFKRKPGKSGASTVWEQLGNLIDE